MNLAMSLMVFLAFLTPGICSTQEKDALGQWVPYFREGQMFVGNTLIEPGKITFDNKLVLRIGSPGVVIPEYKFFSEKVRAVAYPLSGDATHIILRNRDPICGGRQPIWIVLAVMYEKNEVRNDLSVTLSTEDPRKPTGSEIPGVAEKACNQITYLPRTMAEMGERD
ncbi:MAG: hypothetical protein ACRYG8_11080 [Janthinobacterium lividum]